MVLTLEREVTTRPSRIVRFSSRPRSSTVGLDLDESPNAEFAPQDPFSWAESPDESFDVVISGQTFEHDPFFWVTAAEMTHVRTNRSIA